MTGHQCPECGTPRDAGGRRRDPAAPVRSGAADAEAAQSGMRMAAAAEDFDPLRDTAVCDVAETWHESRVGAGRAATMPLPGGACVDAARDGRGRTRRGPDDAHRLRPRAGQRRPPARPSPAQALVQAGSSWPRRRSTVAGHRGLRRRACSPGTTTGRRSCPDRRDDRADRQSAAGPHPTSGPHRLRSADAVPASASGTASRVAHPRTRPRPRRPPATPTARRLPRRPRRRPHRAPASAGAPDRSGSGTLRQRGQRRRRSGAAAAAGRGAGCTWARWTASTTSPWRDAVRAFQRRTSACQGDPKGVYGPKTRRALEAETNRSPGRTREPARWIAGRPRFVSWWNKVASARTP